MKGCIINIRDLSLLSHHSVNCVMRDLRLCQLQSIGNVRMKIFVICGVSWQSINTNQQSTQQILSRNTLWSKNASARHAVYSAVALLFYHSFYVDFVTLFTTFRCNFMHNNHHLASFIANPPTRWTGTTSAYTVAGNSALQVDRQTDRQTAWHAHYDTKTPRYYIRIIPKIR